MLIVGDHNGDGKCWLVVSDVYNGIWSMKVRKHIRKYGLNYVD